MIKIDFTKEQKEKLLEMHGWEKMIGYSMEYEAPESPQVFIILEEFKDKIGKPAEEAWGIKDDWEILRDLEDAWECLIDDVYSQNDFETDEQVDQYLLNKVNNKVAEGD